VRPRGGCCGRADGLRIPDPRISEVARGEVISKSELAEHLYHEDQDHDNNVLEVMLARLRCKLDPKRLLNPIETLRGRGYRFRLPKSSGPSV
jgi:DNA-binding winged helix-turn-helix (wHTH) protein